MVAQDNQTKMQMSPGAIFFSALIGVGFLITFGALGGAVATTIGFDGAELPSKGLLVLIGFFLVVLLVFAFLMAGYIASRLSHQQLRFDSIVHSLGTWAVMAILVVVLASGAAAADGLRRNLRDVSFPALVTDVRVLKSKAVTSVVPDDDEKEASAIADDDRSTEIMTLVWWVAFASLVCGAGASIAGGLLGRRRTAS